MRIAVVTHTARAPDDPEARVYGNLDVKGEGVGYCTMMLIMPVALIELVAMWCGPQT
jgi:hypothetical protein